jgi:hypothetical protein
MPHTLYKLLEIKAAAKKLLTFYHMQMALYIYTRGKKSDWHVKLCLVEQKYPSQNQKTHVPGFSPKYFTIRGRNMDTKHTTGEQITGN